MSATATKTKKKPKVETPARPRAKPRSRTFSDEDLMIRTENIKQLQAKMRRITSNYVLAMGKELFEGHKILARFGTGTYIVWCRDELGIEKTTAFKLKRAYEVFGDCSPCVQTFDASALYFLSQNGIPRWVIEKALAMGREGYVVTLKRAKYLRDAFYDNQDAKKNEKPEEEDDDLDEYPKAKQPKEPDDKKPDKKEPPFSSLRLGKLKRLYRNATRQECYEFRKWLEKRKVQTGIDDDGRRKWKNKPRKQGKAKPKPK